MAWQVCSTTPPGLVGLGVGRTLEAGPALGVEGCVEVRVESVEVEAVRVVESAFD
jgi:hypothetical protein